MMSRFWIAATLLLAVSAVVGCGTASKPAGPEANASTAHDSADHDHSGWWCAEHGVPEEGCTQCDPKAAAEAQKKGDWCAEHERAKSQCFKCDPALKEKFAAQYRAKYDKEPPALEEEAPVKEEKKS